MTDAPLLSDSARTIIAGQLTSRIGYWVEMERRAEANLGEAFPVFLLSRTAVRGSRVIRSLDGFAQSAGYWHVQVRDGGDAVIVAHAAQDSWEVVNLTGAALAPKVATTIAWIDRALPEEGTAKLLVIPDAFVVAFWIAQATRECAVLVSNDGPIRLRVCRAYSIHHLLTSLFGDYRRVSPSGAVA